MPSVSSKQQRLMRAAEHGANFPKAKQIRASMTPAEIREFAESKSDTHVYNWRSRNNLKRGRG